MWKIEGMAKTFKVGDRVTWNSEVVILLWMYYSARIFLLEHKLPAVMRQQWQPEQKNTAPSKGLAEAAAR